jgi:ribose transport system ATP-binding protein
MTTVLQLRGVFKRFPGVQALKNVDFECRAGEVHAIVGENGSGKSTLLAIASGALVPDSGTVDICGQRLRQARPALARRMGLSTVYQDNSLVPDLSVWQNLYLSAPPEARPPYREALAWAREIVRQYGLTIDVRATVNDLPLAERQFLEVIKALVSKPKVLLLDEPTTALGPGDVEHLHSIIREVAAEGAGIVYVSHRLPEVLRLAVRVTVLRDGEHQGTYPTEGLSQDEIIALMVGNPLEVEFPEKAAPGASGDSVVLSVEQLSGGGFGPLDLTIRHGEIVGIAGAAGNGQREILRAIAGFESSSGRVACDGRRYRLNSPTAALRAGVMLISGDRAREAIFPVLGVRHNMTVQVLDRFGKLGVLAGNGERAAASRLVRQLDIVTPSLEQPIRLLSGGNQQKAVMSRGFLYPAKLILIDEPTQGVDAKARLDIYRALRAKAQEGTAIIVNSSDALELAGLCDRVLVVSRGQIVKELEGQDLSEENIVSSFTTSDARRVESRPRNGETRAREVGRLLSLPAVKLPALPQILRQAPALLTAEWTPLWVLVLLILAIGAYTANESSSFASTLNMRHLMLATIPLAIVAMAQLNVLLVGGFDISVGSVISLTVVVASYLIGAGDATGAIIVGAAGSIGIGFLVGAINGALIRGLLIAPVIATIATLSVVQGIALLLRSIPRGAISSDFINVMTHSIDFVPIAFILIGVIAIAADIWLHHSGSGLVTRAVGFREEAARRIGVPTGWIHIRAYLLSGTMAAIGGLFLGTQVGVGHPTVGANFTLLSIAAAVLGGASLFGGRGSFLGAVLGALFLELTVNILPFLEINTAFGLIAAGSLTLIAILLYSGTSIWSRLTAVARTWEFPFLRTSSA